MVIRKTGQGGDSREYLRRHLGEWVSREGCVNTHSRPEATPVRPNEPEGALALMMPESPTSRPQRNVLFLTTAGAR